MMDKMRSQMIKNLAVKISEMLSCQSTAVIRDLPISDEDKLLVTQHVAHYFFATNSVAISHALGMSDDERKIVHDTATQLSNDLFAEHRKRSSKKGDVVREVNEFLKSLQPGAK